MRHNNPKLSLGAVACGGAHEVERTRTMYPSLQGGMQCRSHPGARGGVAEAWRGKSRVGRSHACLVQPCEHLLLLAAADSARPLVQLFKLGVACICQGSGLILWGFSILGR